MRVIPRDEQFIRDRVQIQVDGCWVWSLATRNSRGYARCKTQGRMVLAHRLSYEIFVGPIPKGLPPLRRRSRLPNNPTAKSRALSAPGPNVNARPVRYPPTKKRGKMASLEATSVAVVDVAVLFADHKGSYAGLPGVDLWDEARDARNYAGPWPVVAHPPCQKWCQLAPLNASRLKDYHVGDDGGCFESALEAVRTWGGVLEHPAYSIAWAHFGLPTPGRSGWTSAIGDPGFTTEISQVAYGHAARKRTWLYCVSTELPALNWSEPPATMQVSAFGMTRAKHTSRFGYAEALDKNKSNYTPDSLRDVLISMARTSTTAPEAQPKSVPLPVSASSVEARQEQDLGDTSGVVVQEDQP